jgi:hypothetical protein
MRYDDRLFSKGDLRATLENEKKKLVEAVEKVSREEVLRLGVQALSDRLAEEFTVQPLHIDWDSAYALPPRDKPVDVSWDRNRFIRDRDQPFYLPGTEVTFVVPFDGDQMLFDCRPSTFSSGGSPTGQVQGRELKIAFSHAHPSPADFFPAQFATWKRLVIQYAEWVAGEVEAYNRRVPSDARSFAERRHEKVSADQNLLTSLGVPVRRPDSAAPVFAAPLVRRPVHVETATASSTAAPEFFLPPDTYEEILKSIRHMVAVMERSPSAFAGMHEEQLRDHLLVPLNALYEGNVTGETFNFEGKTDILIRHQGRNTFIAECKVWGGPKLLLDTIDQLLGYTSWRDTKTAIVLFNRNKDLSAVLAKITPTVEAHKNFLRTVPYQDETSFRFVLHHRDDRERELTVTVLTFEVPG